MRILPAAGLAILLLLHPVLSVAAAPIDQVREGVAKLLAILNDPQLKADPRQRREKIKAVIYERFDFTEMAKRSLGAEWRRRTPEEQKEFVKLFTNLLERAYIATVEDVERVHVLGERVDGEYAEVNTKLVDNKGIEFAVDYRLHNVSGDWKVYDVVVDNISLVNNYRSQFNRVLARYSYEELVRRMKANTLETPNASKTSGKTER